MGYIIGSKFQKSGKLQKVPEFKAGRGPGITTFQQRVKRAADISRTAPRFYDPRYSHTTLAVPTDERTLHGLYRYYDDTDPVVGNALRLHVEFPLSGVQLLSCGDPGIQRHFEEMWDRIKGQNLLFDIGLEYWRIGNCLTPETDVFTDDGFKRIDQIRVGDSVLTSSGRFEKVKYVLPRSASELVYHVIPWKLNLFGACTGDHPIRTNEGWKLAHDLKVRDMVQIPLPERIVEDIDVLPMEIHREVISTINSSHKNRPKKEKFVDWLINLKIPVVASYKEVAEKFGLTKMELQNYIVTIKKTGGSVLKHRIYSPQETTKWIGLDFGELTREQIIKGVTHREFSSNIEEVKVTNEFLYLLGYWLGDGCLFKNNGRYEKTGLQWSDWQICFSEKYKYIAEHLSGVIKRVFGVFIPLSGGLYKDDKLHYLHIKNTLFCNWWGKEFGDGCREKRIPKWVLNLPDEKLKHLIAGFIDSDGDITHNGFEMGSVNKSLMYQFFQIGLLLEYAFGIHGSTGGKEVTLPGGYTCVTSPFYTVYFSDKNRADELLKYSHKDKKIFNSIKKSENRDRIKFIDGHWYTEVKKIEVEKYEGKVYDLTIENVPDFVAGGLLVHNCFPFGAWNEEDYMWDQVAILNPDYVEVESTWLSEKPLIKLQPDEALKRIVNTQHPKFLYDQLSPEIIKYVRLGESIPLDSNNVFHIAHNKSPYERLGKSIIKRILKMLMYEDRLQEAQFAIATRHIVPLTVVKIGDPATGWIPEQGEIDDVKEMFCHDEETEVLTDKGFKRYDKVEEYDKIGCFNRETEGLEYHKPLEKFVFDYNGEMIHFKSLSNDIKVTPNHRMLVRTRNKGSWKIVRADKVNDFDHFRSVVNDDYDAQEKLPKSLEIKREHYEGKVWCFEVPTGLFVTRRNGRITVQGNSAYELDPNFTVFYHYGINVEFYGASGKILPVQQELDRVLKLKMLGLGISEQLLTGTSSYASAFASLEVQRQRYLHLQMKLSQFTELGLFKTVSEMCGFYKTKKVSYIGGVRKKYGEPREDLKNYLSAFSSLRDYKDHEDFKKMIMKKAENLEGQGQKEFIYPTLDWSLMSLFNQDKYTELLLRVKEKFPRMVSLETIVKTLHLNKDNETEQSDREIVEEEAHKKRLTQVGLPSKPTEVGGAPESGIGGGGGIGDLGGGGMGGLDLGGEPPIPMGVEAPEGGAALGEPPEEAHQIGMEKVSKEETLDEFTKEIEKDLKVAAQRIALENEELQKKLNRR